MKDATRLWRKDTVVEHGGHMTEVLRHTIAAGNDPWPALAVEFIGPSFRGVDVERAVTLVKQYGSGSVDGPVRVRWYRDFRAAPDVDIVVCVERIPRTDHPTRADPKYLGPEAEDAADPAAPKPTPADPVVTWPQLQAVLDDLIATAATVGGGPAFSCEEQYCHTLQVRLNDLVRFYQGKSAADIAATR